MTLLAQPDGIGSQLRGLPRAPADEEIDAVDFLSESGVSLQSLVLALFDQSDDCIKVIDTEGLLQFMNCNGKKAMQIDDFSIVAGQPWDSLWPEESRGLIRTSLDEAMAGRNSRFDAFCPTAKGEPRWWEVSVSPLSDANGRCVGALSTSRDISERRKREEAAATTASEMRHRLLNAHAVSAALVHACGRDRPEHLQFAQEVVERLGRLSEIQVRILETGGDLRLPALCRSIGSVFAQSGERIRLGDLPDVQLDEHRARAISLILGELTTNSLKHGALGKGGTVDLAGTAEGDLLALTWKEEEVGETTGVTAVSTGQGMTLMRRMLRLYGGSLEVTRGDNRFSVAIRMTLGAGNVRSVAA